MNRLVRCVRPYCGGTILDDACLLCCRTPGHPARVGTLYQRRPRETPKRRDPYAALARHVLAPDPSPCEV